MSAASRPSAARSSAGPARRRPGWRWERRLWRDGWSRVAGIDEVGRGPLAGPVVAAAVILPARSRARWVGELRDSKQLSAAERERLAAEVQRRSAWGVGRVSTQVIDQIGIAPATRLAMRRALAALAAQGAPPDALLVDGRDALGWPEATPLPEYAVIGGDACSVSVAAASIVAKVERDALMRRLDRDFPGYGLAQHKGYATAEHLRALQARGGSTVHRLSFRPVRAALAHRAAR